VTPNIRKPGGFPPKPPGKPEYDNEGFYSDEYSCKLVAYKAKYKRWEKYLKPFEEVFGVPFKFIEDNSLQKEYLRKKEHGLLEPLNIQYDGKHPADEVF
tara:strand:+ start:168 stop:464 length:297 start_codon:yes stop_codon:yes gene_type:complete